MSKQLKAEVIAIGTELLLGQIANTNAQWLSEQLATNGINTFYHTVVGDNLERVTKVFEQAHERSDVIIVSGGLGPTEDDMTREAFQELSQLQMIEYKKTMDKIKDFYKKQQLFMTENNRKQARVFEGAEVIYNIVGMAPGMIVTYEDRKWIFLPGVPREMKEMATRSVFPYLKDINGENSVIQSTELRFIGIGESSLVDKLADIIQNQTNPTIAPLARDSGLVIRLTAKGNSKQVAIERLEQTKQAIKEKVGQYIFGYDDDRIETIIVETLKNNNIRLAAAESITGGRFIEQIISVSGASAVTPGGIVSYSTEMKKNLLEIPDKLIDQHGVVSSECALAMAKNITKRLNTDIGISFTGVAGPEELEGWEAGTVFIAIYHTSGKNIVEKFTFSGDRELIRQRSVMKGFELLLNFFKKEI